jgi:hypothetical protein
MGDKMCAKASLGRRKVGKEAKLEIKLEIYIALSLPLV